jgi:hypothetical protein
MYFEETRVALQALFSQPFVVASVILLAGIHAASWMVVFERIGYPAGRTWLLFVPPVAFLLPLYVVFARWPEERLTRFPRLPRNHWTRPRRQRVPPRQPVARPMEDTLFHPRGVRLAADGLPRYRIPLGPSAPAPQPVPRPYWPAQQGFDPRFLR